MYEWQMEYSNSYPSILIRFTVWADTFEEAIAKGNNTVLLLRRSGTYKTGKVKEVNKNG